MWIPILILSVLSYSCGQPIDNVSTTESPEKLEKDLILAAYIQNFKKIMADYVLAQYQNLTANEVEEVKDTLGDFLTTLAADLKETLHGNGDNAELTKEARESPKDPAFEQIKTNLLSQFPNVTPEAADIMVYKLKKNLYATRDKLDRIINQSKQAQVDNS